MPSGNRVEIEGVTSLARAFRKAGDEDSRTLLLEANKEAAKSVEAAARPNVPVKTGRLANTLRSAGTAKGGVVLIGKAKVPYAGPIHFGWFRRHIRPALFLYDALDSRRDEVEEIYFRRLDELLARVEDAARA